MAAKPPTKKAAAPSKPTVTALPDVEAESLEQLLDRDDLLDVLDGSIEQMTWLKASDAGIVELCRRYARAIDDAVRIRDEYAEVSAQLWDMAEELESKTLMARLRAIEKAVDVGKVTAWVGPLLANALRDIGGTPGERKGLEADAPVKSRLQALREQSQTRKPAAKKQAAASRQ